MRNIFNLLLVIISAIVTSSQAYAITWINVPVVNPGAEVGDMAGWVYLGSMSADDFEPQSMQPINPRSGEWFFSAAQPAGTLATMSQSIDASAFATDIDTGLALYDFGFWYQNEYWDNAWDTGEGRITFYDSAMIALNSYSTGEVANDVWTFADYQDYIPSNARIIKLSFISRRYSGSHINAFYDDISLKVGINQDPVIPEPTTLSLLGLGLIGIRLVFRKKR